MSFQTRKVLPLNKGYSALLFGFCFAFYLSSCDLSKDKEKVEKILNDSVFTEHAENVEMRFSDSGLLKAILTAPVLDRHPGKETFTTFDQGVNGNFYGSQGTIENSLKANYGISYDFKKIVELRNDVQLYNYKNEKLNTDKLIWDQNTGKIYTDAFVKITTPENIIYGEGFESNQNFTEYRIFKVKGEISVNDQDE